MPVIYRIHALFKASVIVIQENLIIQILPLSIPGKREFPVAFLSRFGPPASGQINLLSISGKRSAECGNLVPGNDITVTVPANIDRPHKHLFFSCAGSIPAPELIPASIGSVKIPHDIRHARVRIYQSVPRAVPAQMIHMGSCVHGQYLIFCIVCQFCQVTTCKFQKFQGTFPGKGLITPVFSICLRRNFQYQIAQVVIQDIRVRPHDGNGIPDISFRMDDFTIMVHAGRPGCRIKVPVFVPFREKFCLFSSVSFLYIHTVNMSCVIPLNYQSLIRKILGIARRSQGNGVKERHSGTCRILCGGFLCKLLFRLCLQLLHLQADRFIFQINPGRMALILRLCAISRLLICRILIDRRKDSAVRCSVLIIGHLVRINFQRYRF